MTTNSKQTEQHIVDQIANDCLAVRVRLLSRTITRIYDDAFRPMGITVGQMNILVSVAKRGPISPGEVARFLNMEKSTVSRNIDRMVKHGWLTVSEGESGRKQILALHRKGSKLLEKSLPLWKEAQSRATAVLGQRGAQSIHRIGNVVWAHLGSK